MAKKAKGSPRLNAEMAGQIKWYLLNADLNQHDIAALFGVNQGRVSEVNTGQKHSEVPPLEPGSSGHMAA